MLASRLIPCLDVKNGRVVKGVKFQNLRDAGCPVACAQAYASGGADELVMLDVSATQEGRAAALETVRSVRAVLNIPLCVGGGVRSIDDARALLDAGADKVAVNTAAVMRPQLVSELADAFGRQCTVVAVDAKRTTAKDWSVVIKAGTESTDSGVVEWCRQVEGLGAGEILLTSWDRDGTGIGYDLDLLKAVTANIRIPVIASGGAKEPQHMVHALNAGASAVLAASIFHDAELTIFQVKQALKKAGSVVRL